jgi:beta-fructofuranosidase
LNVRDPHFPTVHLRPPRHWVNDPNGLVFHDRYHHVFFQYNPQGVQHVGMHWGHWRSRDLLRWELLPVAISPTPGGFDAEGVWSGNAVSAGDHLVAFYSAKRDDRWWQPIAAATSADGVAFDKTAELLVSDPPAGTVMFRDPYVWRDGDRWRMLVGATLEGGRGAALHYGSDDLSHWRYLGHYLARAPEQLADNRDTGKGWECVQLATLAPDRAALVFSVWDPEGGAAHVATYVGEDLGFRFEPHQLQLFDHGPDCYAPAVMQAPDGRWLAWAWIWEARDEHRVGAPSSWTDEVGWAGMLSLPRELTLTEHGLHQAVAREIDLLRGGRLLDVTWTVTDAAPAELGQIDRSTDLVATLGRSTDGRAAAGLRVVTSADGSEHLDVGLDPGTGDLIVDRAAASLDPRAKKGSWRIPIRVPPGGSVELRALIDHSVIEIFTSNGEALTLRFYPTGTSDWRLLARALGSGEVRLTVTAWQLAPLAMSSYEPNPRST